MAKRETGGQPDKPGRWGWREKSLSLVPEWEPLGRRIGWVDDTYMYLEGESAFAAVQRMASAQNDSLGVSKAVLWRRMNDAKLLVETDKTRDRLAVRKSINGVMRYVYVLDVLKINIYIAGSGQSGHSGHSMGSEATDGAGFMISGGEKFPASTDHFNRPPKTEVAGFDGQVAGSNSQLASNFVELSNNNDREIKDMESEVVEVADVAAFLDIYMPLSSARPNRNQPICCKNCRFCGSAETDRAVVCEAGIDVDSKITKWTRWYCDSFEPCS